MKKNEKQILQTIKYTPPIVIIIVSILITFFIYLDYSKTLEKEKLLTINNFLQEEKAKVKQSVEIAVNYIKLKEKQQLNELKVKLRKELHNAKTIATGIYKRNKEIKSKKEITKLIKDALRDIRFLNGRGYIFINQFNGIRVLHPIFPNKEGIDISKNLDKNGIQRFKITQDIVRTKGEGFAQFHFYHPKKPNIEKNKLLFIEHFKPYNWIFGTGEYLLDFEKEVKKSVISDITQTNTQKKSFIILSGDGTFLSHPNKKFINKNIYKNKELKNLIPIFKEMEKIKKSKPTYLTNDLSINPQTKKNDKKVFYTNYHKNWDWFITSGFYENKVNTLINKTKQKLEDKYNDYYKTIILSSLLVTIILLFISFSVAKILERKFLKYKRRLEEEIDKKTKQKNLLQKAQEVARMGHWELDLSTMKAHWSDNIIEMFKFKDRPKDVGPELLQSLVIKEDWKNFEDSLSNCLETRQEHNCEYRIKTFDDEIKWISCKGKLNKEGTKITGIVQDITIPKKLEEEKQQKEELLFQQSKLAAMGEMIGNIAHQWRQPLSTISTASTGLLFQKELDLLKDEEFERALKSINKNVQYLSQTIDDFRDFYKPNRSKNIFKMQEVIDKTLGLISSQFTSKNIEIIKEVENSKVFTLESELIQVLINILNNARDALENSQKKKKLIFINIKNKNNYIYIDILDNAGGIKQDILKRVFEPYFTTKHKAQGTGIGLYMSQEIITKHLGGTIKVSNHNFNYKDNDYKGALFEITLPIEHIE